MVGRESGVRERGSGERVGRERESGRGREWGEREGVGRESGGREREREIVFDTARPTRTFFFFYPYDFYCILEYCIH